MGRDSNRHQRSSKLSVLLLPLEFATWQRACHWTYAAQLGFEEGFASNNMEFFTIPVLQEVPSSGPGSWLYYAPRLCKSRRFDQVWLWLVHPQYDEAFLEWVKDIAPIRVGFLMESLEYSEQELEAGPHLRGRKKQVENQARYLTHILACDEADAQRIDEQGLCKALWFPSAVPETSVTASPVIGRGGAVFCGSAYGLREPWLEHPELKGLLIKTVSQEHCTEYPKLFDELNREAVSFLVRNRAPDEASLAAYLNVLRNIRQGCFKLWLSGLRTGCAVVNLPHLFKSYAGRVVEAMSAGRPVISWEIPNRPRAKALFENGKEILLFDKSKPEHLADHIRHIQKKPDFARQMTENALNKVSRFHTIEKRIRQVLDWIATGAEPDFGEIEQDFEDTSGDRRVATFGANAHRTGGQIQNRNGLVDRASVQGDGDSTAKLGDSQTKPSYFIKTGYRCNLGSNGSANPYFDDVENSSSYQAAVYRFAAEVIKENGLTSVLDIGCGFGIKLGKYIYPVCHDVTGIDFEHAVQFCKKTHDFGKWFVDDIESPRLRLDKEFDLIIAADVIEHLVNPDRLFDYILLHCHPETHVILSTPERDIARGKDDYGPPANRAHVREWNMSEFRKYISGYGFDILNSFTVKDKDDSLVERCQVSFCKPGAHLLQRREKETDSASGSVFVSHSLPESTDAGDSTDSALDCFIKATEEFNKGDFETAVEYMQKYRTTVDYSKFRRACIGPDKDEKIDVSVIVVTYQRNEDLRKCLNALSKQDCDSHSFEVIVVDNGGSDFQSFKQYVDQYIECPLNFNLSEGRNIGACCAKGRIVAFLDDDAVVPPDYVGSIKAAFEAYDIFGLRGMALPKNDPEANRGAGGYNRGGKPFPTLCDLEGNSAFLRNVYLSLDGMDPLLFGHEGSDLTYRIAQKYNALNKVIYWPETKIYHDAAVGDCLQAKRDRYRLMDMYLSFKHGVNIFRLRAKIENQPLPAKVLRFSFVMIVLNGMPLVEYSLKSIYDFAHEIIIVEGAVENCLFAANPDGSSKDGTVEFVKSFPDPENKIRLIQGKWPEKCEMQNEALKYVTGNYVWLIDSDEVYKEEDLERIKEILKADSSITQVNFIPDNFWKGLDHVIVSAKFFERSHHYRRLFKCVPGAKFTSHRPPTMIWPGSSKTTEQMNLLDGLKARQMGIVLYHYSYLSARQVKQKNDYYGNLDRKTNRWGLDRGVWYNECFLKWNPQNCRHIESRYPVWMGDKDSHTQSFEGTHPKAMIEYARRFNRSGEAYPSPPIMQNLIDALDELKERFPNVHLGAIETGTIRTFHAAGSSTYCISRALGGEGRLTSVDISSDSIRISKNFCHDISNVEWVESDSITYLAELRGREFHFAFLDSENDKDTVFKEFCLLIPVMVQNSILIIDDAGITRDGGRIDSTVPAQKGHKVWRFLKSCGAEFEILGTPNVVGTQLKVTMTEKNLQLIKDNIRLPDGSPLHLTDLRAALRDDGSASYEQTLAGDEKGQICAESGNFKLPWARPITKDKWRSFLSHDFTNVSRETISQVLREYLGRTERPFPLDFVEVGFGQCYDFIKFAKRFHDEGKINYVGYDITEQFVKYAREEYPGYSFRHGGFLSLETDSFYISYTRHTFEHLSPDLYEACLRKMLKATRDLCIITWFKPPSAKESFRWSESDGFEHTGAYVNTYAKRKILAIAERAGFHVEILEPDSNDEIYLLKRKACCRSATAITVADNKPTVHFAYSGDPYDDNAIRAPRTITNRLFRFLQRHANVKYYDWADKTTPVDVGPKDIVLGHPNPQKGTVIRRLFERQCAGKYLIWPFHTRLPEINRYAKDVAETADRLFVISGPYWIETIDQTEYASWKEKIIRLDNAIDSKAFPLLKTNFNPPGRRGLFVFGRTGPEKGTKQLFELLCKTNCPVLVAGDYSRGDLQIVENRPDTHILGQIDWRNAQTTTFILSKCDFFVNMSVSDASPTTLLESIALGLIPITTPECGYDYDSFLFLSLSQERENLEVLRESQQLSDAELKKLQAENRRIIEREHTWEKFCQTVWQNIKPSAKAAGGFVAQPEVEEYLAPEIRRGDNRTKVLIVRSDSIGDFVIFGGAIPYYRKVYPDAHIAVVVTEGVAELAEACPFIDEVITFNRGRMCSHHDYADEFISFIRNKKYDVAICPAFSRDKVSEYIAINSGAAERITCSGDDANLPADVIRANDAHYTKIVQMSEGVALETFRNEEFLKGLGVSLDGPRNPTVWITQADSDFAEHVLSERGIKDPMIIAPFAQQDIRNWPAANWVELLSLYPEMPVIICGVERDKPAAEEIISAVSRGNIHNLCGLTTVRQLAALIAKCRVCISSESAAAHFAAVANRPHVVLIGGGHFGRFMPYSSQTKLVYSRMNCYNCNWRCKYGRDIRCIRSISVRMVSQAVDEVFGRAAPKRVFGDTKPAVRSQEQVTERSDYLVSAIVSTYNSEKYIRGCLDDLERQTIADKLEIIVINSGSEQNEEAAVRQYQQKYDNIVYIKTEQREGIYSAWNRALKVARGQFITSANTDDRHREDALEIMAATLQANPDIVLVYGDQIRTDTPNDTFANHHGAEMLRRPDYSRERLLLGCCVGSQPMWRKSLHDELGYFDETLTCASDWDFWIRVSSRYKFRHIPEVLGLYYYNKDGIEHGRKTHSLYERYIVGKRYGTPYISVIPLYQSGGSPLVSVIMPAYNAAGYIAEAIESVLIQNHRNFEFIVVDDGSTDDTENVVAGFQDDKIKYFYKENAGPASARNLAIQKSSGDFLINLDADDMITPDFIARHLQEFEKHPDADLVYCDDCLIDENAKPIRVIARREYQDRKSVIRDLFRCGFPVVPFRTCMRRRVFEKIGLYDESLLVAEDYDMMRRFVKEGLKIRHLKDALYLRRLTAKSLSRNYTARNAECHFEVIRRFIDTFPCEELFPDLAWHEISPEMRQLHAKCRAAVTYLGIGRAYVESNATLYAKAAFGQACSELKDCLQMDPANHRVRQMLEKCELVRGQYENPVEQTVC
ncbi:MAG: glycosyltransferase [Planctomycetota bacterium]|jgi:glycosyltransferase involved in cell wall biosynthesis/ADP-heptose:LPS heptosyltransferase/uncharacterized UPF0146 family protein